MSGDTLTLVVPIEGCAQVMCGVQGVPLVGSHGVAMQDSNLDSRFPIGAAVQDYHLDSAASPLALPGGLARCVELFSFAKTFQMGGFRLVSCSNIAEMMGLSDYLTYQTYRTRSISLFSAAPKLSPKGAMLCNFIGSY